LWSRSRAIALPSETLDTKGTPSTLAQLHSNAMPSPSRVPPTPPWELADQERASSSSNRQSRHPSPSATEPRCSRTTTEHEPQASSYPLWHVPPEGPSAVKCAYCDFVYMYPLGPNMEFERERLWVNHTLQCPKVPPYVMEHEPFLNQLMYFLAKYSKRQKNDNENDNEIKHPHPSLLTQQAQSSPFNEVLIPASLRYHINNGWQTIHPWPPHSRTDIKATSSTIRGSIFHRLMDIPIR
jgi:hypothetical protein